MKIATVLLTTKDTKFTKEEKIILKSDRFPKLPSPFFVSFVRFVVRSYFLIDSATYGSGAGKFSQAAKPLMDSRTKFRIKNLPTLRILRELRGE